MNYELVSVLRVETDNWKQQKQRAINNNSKVITLLPDPFFTRYKKEEYENMMNIVDHVTRRTYDEKKFLIFRQSTDDRWRRNFHECGWNHFNHQKWS